MLVARGLQAPGAVTASAVFDRGDCFRRHRRRRRWTSELGMAAEEQQPTATPSRKLSRRITIYLSLLASSFRLAAAVGSSMVLRLAVRTASAPYRPRHECDADPADRAALGKWSGARVLDTTLQVLTRQRLTSIFFVPLFLGFALPRRNR